MQWLVIFIFLCAQLVDGGAEVDARDDASRTPLAVAAWQGNANAVEALLSRGADVDARDMYVLNQAREEEIRRREREREKQRETETERERDRQREREKEEEEER
jgi:hypothetical protein